MRFFFGITDDDEDHHHENAGSRDFYTFHAGYLLASSLKLRSLNKKIQEFWVEHICFVLESTYFSGKEVI